MGPSNRGLGKGLSALISEGYSTTTSTPAATSGKKTVQTQTENNAPTNPMYMTVDKLRSGKFQPRSHFDETALSELAESIEKNGIMQPIVIRPLEKGQYEIIAGERRWRAAKMAGLREVPVIVRDISDQVALELALVENIQRQDLTPLEEASGYQRLMDDFGYTQEELSSTVGKSRSHIANLLRLMDLPQEIKDLIDEGKLSAGHARALLGASNQIEMAHEVIRRGLNVRQTEKFLNSGVRNSVPRPRASGTAKETHATSSSKDKDPDILALEETLSENLGLKVSINDRGQSGEIMISYNSLEQLDEILRRLGGSF